MIVCRQDEVNQALQASGWIYMVRTSSHFASWWIKLRSKTFRVRVPTLLRNASHISGLRQQSMMNTSVTAQDRQIFTMEDE